MPGTPEETAEAASSKIVELPGRLTTILKAESSAAVRGLELAHALQGLPLSLFTQVRGIGILGSSCPRSCIAPPRYPCNPPPSAPLGPALLELVTPVYRYARLGILP
jgi:hypothetical protein